MDPRRLTIALADEAATVRLAEDIALILKKGDLLLLSGDLGAGKSTLARALIRAVAGDPVLEVPSPTFTLVQAYDLRLPISHFDLYRLSDPEELAELGLDEALETGAALVEWPERAADLPGNPILLSITDGDLPDTRTVVIEADAGTMDRVNRTLAIRAFLKHHGAGAAARRFLIGDASTRAYETVATGEIPPPILMNAPSREGEPTLRDGLAYWQIAHLAYDVTAFIAVGNYLRSQGFAAPEIRTADRDAGLLLIENLGGTGFLSEDGEPIEERYAAAIDLLAELHRRPPPRELLVEGDETYRLPDYDPPAMLVELELLPDWYFAHSRGAAADGEDRARYLQLWQEIIARLENAEKGLVLRDYHSPNIIWREEKQGLARLGIIDFQDAMIGPAAYDVASLVQDARVTIPDAMAARLIERYVAAREGDEGFDETGFRESLAIMAAQRASKILGIFVRLDRRDGKPGYLKHLPRIEHYLAIALKHEALTELRAWYRAMGFPV